MYGALHSGTDRKAGAEPPGETPGSMADIARALNSTASELASFVRNQNEDKTAAAGTMKGLSRRCEERVFLLRACEQYDVKIGAGEYGKVLVEFLKKAQLGSSTTLRRMGFRQRVTEHLAIGLAGPYWGGITANSADKHSLLASDFTNCTDAELDDMARGVGHHQRQPMPQRTDDWRARSMRGIDVWCGVYGEEWRAQKQQLARVQAAHVASGDMPECVGGVALEVLPRP
jgi:hypothetical protein